MELQHPSYQLFWKDRPTNGGGLVVYVKNNLICTAQDDLQINGIEALWLEINLRTKNLFFWPMYTDRLLQIMPGCLHLSKYAEDKETILLCDFNINLFDSNSSNTWNWLQVTDSVNLSQLADVHT